MIWLKIFLYVRCFEVRLYKDTYTWNVLIHGIAATAMNAAVSRCLCWRQLEHLEGHCHCGSFPKRRAILPLAHLTCI